MAASWWLGGHGIALCCLALAFIKSVRVLENRKKAGPVLGHREYSRGHSWVAAGCPEVGNGPLPVAVCQGAALGSARGRGTARFFYNRSRIKRDRYQMKTESPDKHIK